MFESPIKKSAKKLSQLYSQMMKLDGSSDGSRVKAKEAYEQQLIKHHALQVKEINQTHTKLAKEKDRLLKKGKDTSSVDMAIDDNKFMLKVVDYNLKQQQDKLKPSNNMRTEASLTKTLDIPRLDEKGLDELLNLGQEPLVTATVTSSTVTTTTPATTTHQAEAKVKKTPPELPAKNQSTAGAAPAKDVAEDFDFSEPLPTPPTPLEQEKQKLTKLAERHAALVENFELLKRQKPSKSLENQLHILAGHIENIVRLVNQQKVLITNETLKEKIALLDEKIKDMQSKNTDEREILPLIYKKQSLELDLVLYLPSTSQQELFDNYAKAVQAATTHRDNLLRRLTDMKADLSPKEIKELADSIFQKFEAGIDKAYKRVDNYLKREIGPLQNRAEARPTSTNVTLDRLLKLQEEHEVKHNNIKIEAEGQKETFIKGLVAPANKKTPPPLPAKVIDTANHIFSTRSADIAKIENEQKTLLNQISKLDNAISHPANTPETTQLLTNLQTKLKQAIMSNYERAEGLYTEQIKYLDQQIPPQMLSQAKQKLQAQQREFQDKREVIATAKLGLEAEVMFASVPVPKHGAAIVQPDISEQIKIKETTIGQLIKFANAQERDPFTKAQASELLTKAQKELRGLYAIKREMNKTPTPEIQSVAPEAMPLHYQTTPDTPEIDQLKKDIEKVTHQIKTLEHLHATSTSSDDKVNYEAQIEVLTTAHRSLQADLAASKNSKPMALDLAKVQTHPDSKPTNHTSASQMNASEVAQTSKQTASAMKEASEAARAEYRGVVSKPIQTGGYMGEVSEAEDDTPNIRY